MPSRKRNALPKLAVEDPLAMKSEDWQVQEACGPSEVKVPPRPEVRDSVRVPAPIKLKPSVEVKDVEATPDFGPMLPPPEWALAEDWLLVEDRTPRTVPTEMTWMALDPPSFLEVLRSGPAGPIKEQPRLPEKASSATTEKTVMFEDDEVLDGASPVMANEKDERWETSLERRKGMKKEKGARAKRLARQGKEEKEKEKEKAR
jgi:hypothetical protein